MAERVGVLEIVFRLFADVFVLLLETMRALGAASAVGECSRGGPATRWL
jgi:hypothetical protein